jgi:hypothetical protein
LGWNGFIALSLSRAGYGDVTFTIIRVLSFLQFWICLDFCGKNLLGNWLDKLGYVILGKGRNYAA